MPELNNVSIDPNSFEFGMACRESFGKAFPLDHECYVHPPSSPSWLEGRTWLAQDIQTALDAARDTLTDYKEREAFDFTMELLGWNTGGLDEDKRKQEGP